MRRFLLIVLLSILAISANAQFDLSLRDTRFASVGYTLKNHWLFRFESSLFNADEQHQNFLLYSGYTYSFKGLTATALPYYGMAWDANYKLAGGKLNVSYNILNHAIIEATYNPHWDSMYGFNNCYMAGIEVPINNEISAVARFQNIPEYRVVANRVRVGLRFRVKNLTVTPEFSFAANKILKPMRVMVGMNYTFKSKKADSASSSHD